MKEGHCFTIEPMVNAGTWKDTHWPDGWTAVTKAKKKHRLFDADSFRHTPQVVFHILKALVSKAPVSKAPVFKAPVLLLCHHPELFPTCVHFYLSNSTGLQALGAIRAPAPLQCSWGRDSHREAEELAASLVGGGRWSDRSPHHLRIQARANRKGILYMAYGGRADSIELCVSWQSPRP